MSLYLVRTSRPVPGSGVSLPKWPLRLWEAARAAHHRFAEWRWRRRAVRELMALDDRTLRDINLRRDDIYSTVGVRRVSSARSVWTRSDLDDRYWL